MLKIFDKYIFYQQMEAWFSALKDNANVYDTPASRAAGWAWAGWRDKTEPMMEIISNIIQPPVTSPRTQTWQTIQTSISPTHLYKLISADFLTAKIVRIAQHFWTIWNHHWLRNDHWPCLIKPRLQNMKILVWLHQSQEAVDSIKIICSGAAAASLSVLVSHIRQTNTLKWLDA